MAVLQVRNMSDDLYCALGRRAAMDNRSISQEVIEIIKRYLASPRGTAPASDEAALQLAGSWIDDRPEKEISADLRKARTTKRFRGEL